MNYKQLTDAIRLCGSRPEMDRCRACAYFAGRAMHRCIPRMTADAADAIDGLLASLKAEQARCCLLYTSATHDVQVAELQAVVSQRGYYPVNTPVANYDPKFVKGVLIGAWPQVEAMILKNREDLPF